MALPLDGSKGSCWAEVIFSPGCPWGQLLALAIIVLPAQGSGCLVEGSMTSQGKLRGPSSMETCKRSTKSLGVQGLQAAQQDPRQFWLVPVAEAEGPSPNETPEDPGDPWGAGFWNLPKEIHGQPFRGYSLSVLHDGNSSR